ncbi:MAG TPA: EAL domain-containing protein [Burkholderiales bacterium]|nr:EAL domain-containing protein [Burkholderiales bacterium]
MAIIDTLKPPGWPIGNGEMPTLIRTHNWSTTSLGPISTWPQSLKSTVDILLRFPMPVVMLWGVDGVLIYNDAYSLFANGLHPRLLGRTVMESWPANAWLNPNVLKMGLAGGSLAYRDQEFTLYRSGRTEQVWLNLDYSPVFDEKGNPTGVLAIINETTEKVRVERQLRANEQRLRFALNAARMGAWAWDPIRDVLSPDENTLKILGEPSDSGLSMATCFKSRLHPEDRERFMSTLQAALDPKSSGHFAIEYRWQGPNGREIWLSQTGQTHFEIFGQERRAVQVTGTLVDITADHEAADRLRKSEARLAAIFAQAAVGLSEIGLDGRFLSVNDKLCHMLQQSREQLLNASVPDVTHPDDLPNSLAALGRLIKTGEPASLDKRYVRPDGAIVWATSSLTRLDNEHGDPRAILAVTVDLTERIQGEEKLRDSEQRFRALAEASPALIWQLDPEGNVVYVNRRYMSLIAIEPEELLGVAWHDIVHPEDAPAYIEAVATAQRTRSAMHLRTRVKNGDGQWRWLEVYGSPWYCAGGEYAGHAGIAIDITDAMRVQEELMVSNERLDLAIEGSGDGVWDWNIQTDKLIYSKQLLEMLGYSDESFFANYQDWEKNVHPEDLPEVLAALHACLRGATPTYRSEFRMRCKNGEWKWILSRAIVVARDAEKKPLRMTGTATDISEKRRSEEVIWRHANFDTLTGLPNRRLFRDRLDQEVKKAHRTRLPIALLFIDLDRFKEANDVLGHDVGDLLLIEAAKRISRCVRESDTVARLGGDEFTAILPMLEDMTHVQLIAQKMVDALAAPFRMGNEVVYLSASVGITFYPTDALQAEELIRNADQAMYAAKNAGRNQFSYFTRLMQQEAHDRMRVINDLRNALNDGQFHVYYQPVVDLSTGDISKAEALLRWRHPKWGLIEPLRFIPLAEESGLINAIGDWVFKQAASCVQNWSTRLGAPFQISVNKSPVQFLSRSEETDWPNYLTSLGLPGSCISVEITEGVLLNASASVVNKLLQYRDAGIQVAIDDFGTGYSSMAYLRKFDIDYVKIDQSFVKDMVTDAGNRAIVRSVVAMAHELGLKVIAEGIETAEQKQLLIETGCDFGQGFLFSEAVPAKEFERIARIGH